MKLDEFKILKNWNELFCFRRTYHPFWTWKIVLLVFVATLRCSQVFTYNILISTWRPNPLSGTPLWSERNSTIWKQALEVRGSMFNNTTWVVWVTTWGCQMIMAFVPKPVDWTHIQNAIGFSNHLLGIYD
jgi:hypothetical protein